MRLTKNRVWQASEEFVKAWNNGDLEKACELYAPDATFIGPGKVFHGKEIILEMYQASYPNRSVMGVLSLTMIDFRSPREANGTMASAVFKWSISVGKKGEFKSSGYVMETYRVIRGKVRIMQDMSM